MNRLGAPTGTLILSLFLWEISVRVFHIPGYLLPSPLSVAGELIFDISTFVNHGLITTSEAVLGLIVASLLSLVLASFFALSSTLHRSISPILVALKSMPVVALAPLLTVWLGYGSESKILMAAIVSFFPLVVNATLGMTQIDPLIVDLMRSLGSTRMQMLFMARFPAAMPEIFAGVRISAPLSVMGAIVAEMTGGDKGLGYLIVVSTMRIATTRAFAALVVACFLGVASFWMIGLIEKLAGPRRSGALLGGV